MSAPDKIRLWKELSKSADVLEHSCSDLIKRDAVQEREAYLSDIDVMNHQFRESFALLFLLRGESKLMGGLIDHDFIDRFAAIDLHLGLLSRRPSTDRLTNVCETIWVFSQVVKSLIFWIDHEVTTLEKTMLDEYVVQVRGYLSRIFPSLELAVNPIDKDLPVIMHKGIITNILINMIVNAVKHGEATRVELMASKLGQDKAEMTVQDNGSGIPLPFHDIVPGLGLLHLQKRMDIMQARVEVEEHGGINGGAAFRLIFPLAYDKPEVIEVKIEEPPEV